MSTEYTWQIGNTMYRLFPDHNPQMARVEAYNPSDPRPREFFFPKKLLGDHAQDLIVDRMTKLFDDLAER